MKKFSGKLWILGRITLPKGEYFVSQRRMVYEGRKPEIDLKGLGELGERIEAERKTR